MDKLGDVEEGRICRLCDGDGYEGNRYCRQCHGSGRVSAYIPEAADEITSLKGEVERLTILLESAKDQFDRHVEWASEQDAAKQALIDELVDGLEVYGDHLDRCAIYRHGTCDCGLAALISKARSSGKAGSDA